MVKLRKYKKFSNNQIGGRQQTSTITKNRGILMKKKLKKLFNFILCPQSSENNDKYDKYDRNKICAGRLLIWGTFFLFFLLCSIYISLGALIGMATTLLSLLMMGSFMRKIDRTMEFCNKKLKGNQQNIDGIYTVEQKFLINKLIDYISGGFVKKPVKTPDITEGGALAASALGKLNPPESRRSEYEEVITQKKAKSILSNSFITIIKKIINFLKCLFEYLLFKPVYQLIIFFGGSADIEDLKSSDNIYPRCEFKVGIPCIYEYKLTSPQEVKPVLLFWKKYYNFVFGFVIFINLIITIIFAFKYKAYKNNKNN